MSIEPPWLEIILPVRNPGPPFLDSIGSLEAQQERGFGVVLSDNHSTAGQEVIGEAGTRLEAAGIPVRRVRPPAELSRVEHWNWAHHAGRATWLKPLFAGDLLAPEYVAELRARLREAPAAQVARCEFQLRTAAACYPAERAPTSAPALTPAELLGFFPERGNWLGGPVNFAYTRAAWVEAGGYATHLPACADLDLYLGLALRHGLELLPKSLATFQLHAQRFSMGIRQRPVSGTAEFWLILRQARSFSLAAGLPWPKHGVRSGVWLQLRLEYLRPLKERLLGRFR